ncbi:hypothetical protein AURDEDRAFT_143613 [Auricularia subglabra TFB-10046 SS5]|nr:hypothetical protein AURDEDRAFT_143613 [Auricularia subglabra TFB-10046 SS5]
MANNSVLTMFDPLKVALPPSGPSTPLNGTLSKGGDGRTPLTLSTFFNRRPAEAPPPTSPKRGPNPRQPLVDLDESMTVCGSDDEDDENKDGGRVSNAGSLRILVTDTPHGRAGPSADELLSETPYGTLRKGHALPHPLLDRGVLGASTASVDSLSLRDLGISLTNSTTLSLLRIPEPPQLSQLRDRDSASISSQRRPRHPSIDNSSSLDLSLTDVSFDILHDELAMPTADSEEHGLAGARDDFMPLPPDDPNFPRTSTLASRRGGRPSHAIVNDFSTMEIGEISPVKPRSSMSPVRNAETAAEGTPVMSPSRKSKFTFKRWDKGTPSSAASKSAAGTPRATSPVSTPKGTSFFDKLRGTPQESKRKPSTPLAPKPATPVGSASPASTVKASGDHDDEAADELGVRAPPAKRPVPSRTSSSGSTGTMASASSPTRKTAVRSSSAFNLRGSKASSSSSGNGARSPVQPMSAKTSTVGSRRVPASSSTAASTAAATATKPVVPRFKAPTAPASKLPATRPPVSSASTTASATTMATKPSSKLQLPSIRPRAAPRPSVAPVAPVPAITPAPPKRSLTLTRPSTLTKPRPSIAPAPAPEGRPITHSARASISVTSGTTKPVGFGHTRSRSQIPSSASMPLGAATAPGAGITRSNSAALSRVGGGLKKPEERVTTTTSATRRTFGLR